MEPRLHEHTLTLPQGRLHFWKGGKGRPLLLLHNACGNAEFSWGRVWGRLAKRYTVLAPDLPGFGESQALGEPSMDSLAEALGELLARENAENAVVVGNSFSADLALRCARSLQSRVGQVVLVNGTVLPVLPAFLRGLLSWDLPKKWLLAYQAGRPASEASLDRAFPDPEALPPGFLRRAQRKAEKHMALVAESWLSQAKSALPPQVPLALIWGKGDRRAPLSMARALQVWVGEAALRVIEGAGRMPQVTSPAEFSRALETLASPRPPRARRRAAARPL
jgi:pimeloyl-ACP methyl ester carboxylesterase